MKFQRVLLLVMDGCGAGSAPDAAAFGDEGENLGDTLVHTARAAGGLRVPTLRRLGLGNLLDLAGGAPLPQAELAGSYGRLTETSQGGKDTVTGHWEMMGISVESRFPTYPKGFPADLMAEFERRIGRGTLGNVVSSGTVVIDQFGAEHMRTGSPIIYTSADSVFQIAAHEQLIPIEELYAICAQARALLTGDNSVQRVIARPFEGEPGAFKRTERRKDFPLEPPLNVLDKLHEAGVFTAGIGVIGELFGGRGFSFARRTGSNPEHHAATLQLLQDHNRGFFFVNHEDFDMLYGHRNDVPGFAGALEQFDGFVAETMAQLKATDLLLITADHGNDPTTPSTDHTREYAPLLAYSPGLTGGKDFAIRSTYADLGATVLSAFGLSAAPLPGTPLF